MKTIALRYLFGDEKNDAIKRPKEARYWGRKRNHYKNVVGTRKNTCALLNRRARTEAVGPTRCAEKILLSKLHWRWTRRLISPLFPSERLCHAPRGGGGKRGGIVVVIAYIVEENKRGRTNIERREHVLFLDFFPVVLFWTYLLGQNSTNIFYVANIFCLVGFHKWEDEVHSIMFLWL